MGASEGMKHRFNNTKKNPNISSKLYQLHTRRKPETDANQQHGAEVEGVIYVE